MKISHMFKSHANDLGPRGSVDWNRAVFGRAFAHGMGQFAHVVDKLKAGFSLLVYLPGNCMTAAAEYVKGELPGSWKESGKCPPGKAGTLTDIWGNTKELYDAIVEWVKGEKKTGVPHFIYYNLDLLCDAHGGLHGYEAALVAYSALVEATRGGVVLGLADREAGELPAAIRRHFTEALTLGEVDFAGFQSIIPDCLADWVKEGDEFPDALAWQFATSLRWCDPVRAVRLMESVSDCASPERALQEIRAQTCPVGYETPAKKPDEGPRDFLPPRGFNRERVLEKLLNVVHTYRAWAYPSKPRDRHAFETEMKSLPKGIILHGPPGTGKSTLAQWLAGCIGIPYRAISAAEIRKPLYGDTERAIRETFQSARRAAPCVLVLDDGEGLLPERSKQQGSVASAEKAMCNEMLKELEGLRGPLTGVLVVLTTNHFDEMDEAAKERLHIHVHVSYPLDRNQIGEIVEQSAEVYDYRLDDCVKDMLIDYFFGPVRPGLETKGNTMTPEGRLDCTENLYSARQIARNMQLLRRGEFRPGYSPTVDDFNWMKRQSEWQ